MDKIIYKNVSLFRKNDEDLSTFINGKMPSHNISISDNTYQNKKIVGSVWLKQTDKGMFYSGKLDSAYTKKDGTKVDEYVIISQSYLNDLLGMSGESVVEPAGLDLKNIPSINGK